MVRRSHSRKLSDRYAVPPSATASPGGENVHHSHNNHGSQDGGGHDSCECRLGCDQQEASVLLATSSLPVGGASSNTGQQNGQGGPQGGQERGRWRQRRKGKKRSPSQRQRLSASLIRRQQTNEQQPPPSSTPLTTTLANPTNPTTTSPVVSATHIHPGHVQHGIHPYATEHINLIPQVCSPTTKFVLIVYKSLICLEDKSMTPHQGRSLSLLFLAATQFISVGPMNNFLS